MTSTAVRAGVAPPPRSLASRVIGMLTAPRATYESVVAHPQWLGMLALVTIGMAVLVGGFLMTQTGQAAWLETAATSSFGRPVSDQQLEAMQRMSGFIGYITACAIVVMAPLITALVAGVLFAVFNAALGGDATYRQVFAVVVHTGPIGLLGQLFTVPLNYARGTMTSATNLGVFAQAFLEEQSFLARVLSRLDLFVIWQLIVLSMGLAVLYRRRTQPVATTLLVFYLGVAIVIALARRGAGA